MSIQRDVNDVTIIGRLTRDMTCRWTSAGNTIGNLDLAVNRLKKKHDTWEEEAHFFPVVIYGKLAERLASSLKKGTRIAVKGELQQQKWEYQEKKYQKVVIQADMIQLLGKPRQQSAQQSPSQTVPPKAPQQPKTSVQQQQTASYAEEDLLSEGPEFFNDDIPF